MPLYEYVCRKCHNKFAEVLTIKEHETKKVHCPKCKGTDWKKSSSRSSLRRRVRREAIDRGVQDPPMKTPRSYSAETAMITLRPERI